MQARLKNESEIKIVELIGRIEIEGGDAFRTNLLNTLNGQKVIFDLTALSFVGSTGILAFLEALQDFAYTNPQRFKFCHVSSEFKKIFAATNLNCIEIYENLSMAVSAYQNIETTQNAPAHAIPFKRDASIFRDLDIIDAPEEAETPATAEISVAITEMAAVSK